MADPKAPGADQASAGAAPAKRKRAAFTRTEKPVFAIVKATDQNGAPIALTKAGLSITLEKDAAKLVDLVTSSDMQGAVVIKVKLPPTATRKPADPAA